MPNPGGHSFLFDFAKNQLSHLSTQIGSSRKPAFILSSYSWRLSLIDNASLRMVIRNAHATMITTMRNNGIRTQHSFRAGAIAIEVPMVELESLEAGGDQCQCRLCGDFGADGSRRCRIILNADGVGVSCMIDGRILCFQCRGYE